MVEITEQAQRIIMSWQDDLWRLASEVGTLDQSYIKATESLARSLSTMLTMHGLERIMADGEHDLICTSEHLTFGVNRHMNTKPVGDHLPDWMASQVQVQVQVPSWSVNS